MLPATYMHMLFAFLLTVLLIALAKRFATELRLVDIPDARKQHDGLVPLCGGFAIFIAFTITATVLGAAPSFSWNWEIGLVMLVLVGMADDRWQLPALPRLALQAIAAVILVSSLSGPLNLGTVWGHPLLLPFWLSAGLSIFFVVGTINAMNMLDGADGLAGCSAVATLFWLALIASSLGEFRHTIEALILLSAVAGFLVFNLRHPWQSRASVFLGDGGSLMLGAALAILILSLANGAQGIAFPALLWTIVIPLVDTVSLIVRRLAGGRSPLSPDRWHMHHLLIDSGISQGATVALIAGVGTLCGGIGYAGMLLQVPDLVMGLGLLIPLVAHSMAVFILRGHHRGLSETFTPSHIHPTAAPYSPQIVKDEP